MLILLRGRMDVGFVNSERIGKTQIAPGYAREYRILNPTSHDSQETGRLSGSAVKDATKFRF